ncbi:MAG: SRPBCC family protein [Actinomycetota bacterium]
MTWHLNHYRFRAAWEVAAEPSLVYGILCHVADYPQWWPEVKELRALDDRRVAVVVRSLLPYELALVVERKREDPAEGLLEVFLHGDVEGVARWKLSPSAKGTRVVFEEEARLRKRLMRYLAPVARPAFLANHALMMRSAEKGLRAFLAGARWSNVGRSVVSPPERISQGARSGVG